MAGLWDPERYEKFKSERARPFFDLLALVQPTPGGRAVDLGCGTGELTRELHRHLHAAATLGLDLSPPMLASSERFAGEGLRFACGDIADADAWAETAPYDIVFSNAALHWIPDHPALLERLTAKVKAGGQLAVQVPANHDHPSHRVARAVAQEEPFVTQTGGLPESPVLPPERYAEILHRLGYVEQDTRLAVYGHTLASSADVVDWVAGSTLTPLRARLDDRGWQNFLTRYRAALLPVLGDEKPYFYTFKRVLFWARRG